MPGGDNFLKFFITACKKKIFLEKILLCLNLYVFYFLKLGNLKTIFFLLLRMSLDKSRRLKTGYFVSKRPPKCLGQIISSWPNADLCTDLFISVMKDTGRNALHNYRFLYHDEKYGSWQHLLPRPILESLLSEVDPPHGRLEEYQLSDGTRSNRNDPIHPFVPPLWRSILRGNGKYHRNPVPH